MFTVGRSPSRPRRVTKRPPVGPDFGKDRLGAGGAVDKVDGTGELFAFPHCTLHFALMDIRPSTMQQTI